MLIERTVTLLTAPSAVEREALRRGPSDLGTFRAALDRFACLHAIEEHLPPVQTPPPARLRVVFWNAERLKYGPASAFLLRAAAADVLLLAEVDRGMARSGNRDTVRDLAQALETGWIFGVEFVELDLGDARERAWHAGQENRDGLHGGAILSRLPLARPALVRLETSGRWFDGTFGERRVGGRIAVLAEVGLNGRSVLLVSTHYESHTDPADRAATTRLLLDAIDRHAPGRPVLIGGDFNTSTFDRPGKAHRAALAAALAVEPLRLVEPFAHEPMFKLLEARGYGWAHCNLPRAPTQRTRPDGTPTPPFGKIDWLFARGLRCSDPAILPAVDPEGVAISDHEVLAVTIEAV